MDPSTTALERYDLAAPGQRQISTIAAVSGPNAGIGSAQIAHDGAWVLFIVSNDATTSGEGRDSLQLVRVDGLDQQVLYCSALHTQMTDLLWSPTHLWAVFSIIDPHTNTVTQDRLHLQDGTVDTLSTTDALSRHIPLIWSTTHASQLYMSTYTTAAGISGPLLGNLVLFDTENSVHQPGLFALSAIFNPGLWPDYALGLDGRTLFLSQCTFAPARGCLAPSTIQVEDVSNPAHPVPTRTIHVGDLAIAHLAILSQTQLVLDVESVGGDTTRNGLWLLHVVWTGQRQLTNSGHLTTNETMLEQHQDPWAYVSRDRAFYCIEDWQGHRLSYGSLSGGNPTPLPVDGARPVGWVQM
jgi:hypothetical protein